MEGLIYDDVPGQQAPGLANEHLDAEGPLPPDVILGHLYPYTVPNQAAFTPQNHASLPEPDQDDIAFGEVDPPLVQPALAQENMLGPIFGAAPGGDGGDGPDLGFAQPQPEVPVMHHLPTALDALTNALPYLLHNHPELAAHPEGPGLLSATLTALTNYMLAHGLLIDAPVAPQALQEDLQPLEGFEDVAGLPGHDHGVVVHWPDVQNGDDAEPEELFEALDVLGHPPVAHGLEAVHQQQGAPLEPAPVLEAFDVGITEGGVPEPALQPELVVDGTDDLLAEGSVNLGDEIPGGEANLVEPEYAPPPYIHGPGPEPAQEVNDDAQPEHGVTADEVNHRAAGVVLPETALDMPNAGEPEGEHVHALSSTTYSVAQASVSVATPGALGAGTSAMAAALATAVRLDDGGRAALTSLCARFDVTDDSNNLSQVLVEAEERIDNLQKTLDRQQSGGHLFSAREYPSPTTSSEKPNRMLKLRDAWRRAFSGPRIKSIRGKERPQYPAAGLTVRSIGDGTA